MRKFTKSFLALTLTALLAPMGLNAQSKLQLPQPSGGADKDSDGSQKATADAKNKPALKAASDYTSPWPLYSAGDKAAYGQYVLDKGEKPNLAPKVVTKAVDQPDSDTKYTYTGFNIAAGSPDGSQAIGGMVNFNLNPFACDTVSVNGGVSPYSYEAKGKLYCFLPTMDPATGKWTSMTRTVYDANTLERLSQQDFTMPGEKDRVPYLLAYDDVRDVVYAISIGYNTSDGYEPYYLNILDTATCQLKRVGFIGKYDGEKAALSFVPKGFSASSGRLFVQYSSDKVYIGELNSRTAAVTKIGSIDVRQDGLYGQQPMVYDGNQGRLLVNHYDFYNGTQYYSVSPYVVTDGACKTELVEETPTGFTFFYQRPETKFSYATTLGDITDLKAEVDGTTCNISFTVPTKDSKGNEIEFPSYASKNLRCTVWVDGEAVSVTGLPSDITYGQQVNCTAELTDGMHAVTVQLYPLWNELGQSRGGTIVVCGYDAPVAVGNPTLSVADGKATITWDAPTKGAYADFGGKFDASDLTYKVVRNTDGKIIAEGITATTATDEDLADEIQTYFYTVYATSHGQTGAGINTNSVSAGKYLPLPYVNEFSDAGCIDGYTVLNLNNDGSYRTWMYNSYAKMLASGWGTGDDWIITPSFDLSADNVYSFGYSLRGNGILYSTVGQGVTPENQDNVLEELNNYTADDYEVREMYFRPSESGMYNFGLHNYGVGEEVGWNVDSLYVKAVAAAGTPDKVRSLELVPDAKGALGATISFKAPATDIAGNSISSLSKVVVYDLKGNQLGSANNVTPGADATVKVTAVHGWNAFKVVAVNDKGEGWPVLVRKFIGLDTPKTITNFRTKWGDDRTIAVLSWDAPTEGVNGGYVDPSAFTYKIYKYDSKSYPAYTELGSTQGENSIEVEIKDASETQDQYIFGITASNDNGESDYTRAGITLGVPYNLPMVEPFAAAGLNYAPWLIVAGKNNQAWTTDEGHYNEKIQPQSGDGLQLVLRNTGTADGSSSFMAPIFDFTNAEHPVMSVWLHHSDAMPAKAYVTLDASIDGSSNFINVGDTVSLTGNNGWTEHLFDLSALKGKKAQVALTGYMPDPSVRIFTDNWTIKEAAGNDLALTAISQPYCPVVGDVADIEVTVANKGAQTAQNYSVLFTVNGETIDEKESTEALALGKEAKFHFTLPITAAQKELIYSAEVMYDGDEVADNNMSTEVELSPEQIELPAPSNLALSNDELSWAAPEAMDGRTVTLGFEDVPAFMVDDIKGWKTVDVDKNITTSFVQYYGNYWPYFNQPFAWMTWSGKEMGNSGAKMWQPYEGEKCIIHFGNYGADAEGRANTDPDDDWFISPEVKGGTEFSFMTLSNDVSSKLEVLTSSTDQELASFTNKVTTVSYDATATWNEVKVTLPADAKYVAIRCILDGFGILVDNVTYTEAKAPVLKGYNVYKDNAQLTTAEGTSAKTSGFGSYAVSAVYDLGESVLSNAVTTGISDATSDEGVSVTGQNGYIQISGAYGKAVNVYTVGGQNIASRTAKNTESVSVPAGMYIVKVGGKAYKVTVKR